MKKFILVVATFVAVACSSCNDTFFDEDRASLTTKSSSLRFLDVSTTDILVMSEDDFHALDAAMQRLEVEYEGSFCVIGRTDYRNLNISKKLYYTVKQLCENGNRLVASTHHLSSFPLIKDGSPESGNQVMPSDCVAYALYGMGADLQVTLPFIQTYYSDGVLLVDMEYVVGLFFSDADKVKHPSANGEWTSFPRPMICTKAGHAVNCVRYTLSSGAALYVDHQNNDSPGTLSRDEIDCFFIRAGML